MRRAIQACVVGLVSAAGAAAQPQSPCASATGRSVTVSGTATLRVAPDRVSFTVGVETIAPSVLEAFKANNAKTNAVLAALKARGVQPQQMQTSNLDIHTQQDPRDPEGRKLGFRVANHVTVTREDPSTVSELLQAAVGAGANQAGGLRFFVAEPGRQQARGLDLAFQSARAKAESLAGQSKRALGDVVCVSENAGFQPVNREMAFQSMAVAAGPGIETGSEELAFSVTVVFELR